MEPEEFTFEDLLHIIGMLQNKVETLEKKQEKTEKLFALILAPKEEKRIIVPG